jgi:hypothetical protein
MNLFRASGVRYLVLKVEDRTNKFYITKIGVLFNFLAACLYYFRQLESVTITFEKHYTIVLDWRVAFNKNLLARYMSDISR